MLFFPAYRGCFSIAGLSSGQNASYASPSAMTIGFCVQVCYGLDPKLAHTSLMGLQVFYLFYSDNLSFTRVYISEVILAKKTTRENKVAKDCTFRHYLNWFVWSLVTGLIF